ncbi:MAG TPA: hypothetical protein VFP60_14215 [Pseudolabrys sp.]|nr:hypothetical protein [Pseudolabrys sp.]
MNCSRIMGASAALLLAGFVVTPADAYQLKRHHRHHYSHHQSYDAYRGDFVRRATYRDTRRVRHRRVVESCTFTNEGRRVCRGTDPQQLSARQRVTVDGLSNQAYEMAVDRVSNRAYAMIPADQGRIIGSRPSGCPHAYCGCGLRKYLGLSDVRLNLASNWARLFPHEAAPRAGLAAVRSGHVMYIEASAGNGQWLVRDYNSGGGLSRLHVRDVRGYRFVNPHAALASRS